MSKMVSFLIIFTLLILLVPAANATDYTVRPSISKEPGAPVYGEKVQEIDPIPYWLYLFLLVFPQLTAMPLETLTSIKVLPYLAYKKIFKKNILDNPKRLKIYNFIEEHPGVYFRELVKRIGLKKGTVEYHLEVMETQKMIVSHKSKGKLRFFLNHSTYKKEDKTVIAALKNDTHRKVILEILNSQSITQKNLAKKIGVSTPTISDHIKYLKKEGIVKTDTKGRYTIYSIDSNYFDLLQKYMNSINC
ncbi:MAG: winged helix-turn-helix transcriptional regulator [Methanosarcinales archaeon]|nr:winged helix-turn-helix transcriptional regulator [Methanosarcinales archaeon]